MRNPFYNPNELNKKNIHLVVKAICINPSCARTFCKLKHPSKHRINLLGVRPSIAKTCSRKCSRYYTGQGRYLTGRIKK